MKAKRRKVTLRSQAKQIRQEIVKLRQELKQIFNVCSSTRDNQVT